MRFQALIPLLGAACNLLVGFFVLSRAPKTAVNLVYCGLSVSIATWNYGTFAMFQVSSAESALFWARFLQYGVIFIPVLLCHLSLLVGDLHTETWRRILWAFYVFSGLLALSNLGGYFIVEVRDAGYAFYGVAGWSFWLFMAPFSLTMFSLATLLKRYRQLPVLHRKRLVPLIGAQGALVVLGLNDILPILGIFTYPSTQIPVYPFGSLAAVFYGLIVGYSVLQHQLLDIQVSLSRFAAHAIRLGFLFGLGFILLLVATMIAPQGSFNWISVLSSLVVLMVSGIVASILFPRLFGSGVEAFERRLLGDRFEYHDRIRGFIESMQWYSDFDLLMSDLHDLLVKTVAVESYNIILLDTARRQFTMFRTYPHTPGQQYPELNLDSAVARFFHHSNAEYIVLGNPSSSPNRSSEKDAEKELKQFNAALCFPFFFEEEPFGWLLAGPKRERDPYTNTDVKLLSALVKSLSLIINQIRLKTQILQAEELDLLGRMSRGMAHDLNNLLTPVHTFLQLVGEGAPPEALREDLLPVALRNLTTMRAYIREALFFSQNLRPDFQLGRLDVLLRAGTDLVQERAGRRGVELKVGAASETRIEMDSVLIERLVTNLLSNAVDASPSGSVVEASLARLPRTESQREWLRIRIQDHGSGIPKEDINRIFTPYFTTKKTGDESRGFGLGLAICRKIVHLHGGTLDISSQPDRGTTVFVDLPSRQVTTQQGVAHGQQ